MYCQEILKKLNDLRHEGSLCDVTLVVDGGREFEAHRCVLAASSPYFCNMFTSDMREKTQTKVSIKALSGSIMEDLLSYLYTGAVKITKESSARDILCAADYLVVPRLKQMADDFFLRNLAVSNCIGVYQLALITSSEQLKDRTVRFINKNFALVAKTEEFMNLSVDGLIEWISSDDVEVKAEDEIFEVVDSWIERNPESRREYLLHLLDHVRLTLVSQEYLHTKILQNHRIRESKNCMDFVSKRVDEGDCVTETPRMCLQLVQCLLACGGHRKALGEDQSNLTCCFVPDQGKWYKLSDMITGQSGHAIATCQDQVYSVGGAASDFPYDTSKVERYDPISNSWAEAAPLGVKLMLLSVASVNGLMYVCGGINSCLERFSKRVFEYNPSTNTWRERASMIHGRSALCVVACDQFIFAIGGYVSDNAATNTVEKFNPSTNTWVQVSSMTENRKLLCAATFQKSIYVFGGLRGYSAELYDAENDQWQKIPHLQVVRAGAGAATVQGAIYVVGGNKCSNFAPEEHKRMMECFDPATGQWAAKGSFPCEEFIKFCACCPVSFPKSLLKSLPELK